MQAAQVVKDKNPFKVVTIILAILVLGLGGWLAWIFIDDANKPMETATAPIKQPVLDSLVEQIDFMYDYNNIKPFEQTLTVGSEYNELFGALSDVYVQTVGGDNKIFGEITVTYNSKNEGYKVAEVAEIPKEASAISPDGGNATTVYFWTADDGNEWQFAEDISGSTFYISCEKFDGSDDFKLAFGTFFCHDEKENVYTYVSYYSLKNRE